MATFRSIINRQLSRVLADLMHTSAVVSRKFVNFHFWVKFPFNGLQKTEERNKLNGYFSLWR